MSADEFTATCQKVVYAWVLREAAVAPTYFTFGEDAYAIKDAAMFRTLREVAGHIRAAAELNSRQWYPVRVRRIGELQFSWKAVADPREYRIRNLTTGTCQAVYAISRPDLVMEQLEVGPGPEWLEVRE